MIEVKVLPGDSSQRSDKFIMKLLPGAGKSLIFKQIRKKNITLNGKKMDGTEKLAAGDKLQFFFSDETFEKFKHPTDSSVYDHTLALADKAYTTIKDIKIVYEDDDFIIMNKPVGVLTQSDSKSDISLNEWLIGYLHHKGLVTGESLPHFKPSVLNRLDRNTSGMVLGSKTLLGASTISSYLKDRSMHKYYLTWVSGAMEGQSILHAFHIKDNVENKVSIKEKLTESDNPNDYNEISTGYRVIKTIEHDKLGTLSLLEIELITGKSHQIRAHMAYIGHPLLGDYKYGLKGLNRKVEAYGIKSQMLHAYRLIMPDGREYTCDLPDSWRFLDGNMEE